MHYGDVCMYVCMYVCVYQAMPGPSPQPAHAGAFRFRSRLSSLSFIWSTALLGVRTKERMRRERLLVDELERRLQEISARIDERRRAGDETFADFLFGELCFRLVEFANENRVMKQNQAHRGAADMDVDVEAKNARLRYLPMASRVRIIQPVSWPEIPPQW